MRSCAIADSRPKASDDNDHVFIQLVIYNSMRSAGTKDRINLSCHEMVCTRAISIDTRVDKWVTGLLDHAARPICWT